MYDPPYSGIRPMHESFGASNGFMGSGGVFRGVGAQVLSTPSSNQITPRPGEWSHGPVPPAVHLADRIQYLEQELLQLRSPRDPHVMHHSPMQMVPLTGHPQPPVMYVSHNLAAPHGTTSVTNEPTVPLAQHQEVLKAHQELLDTMAKQNETHTQLMKAHEDLMKSQKAQTAAIQASLAGAGPGRLGRRGRGKQQDSTKRKHPSIGVIRLDYDYPPAEGDIDCPASYGYDVHFRVIPKMTFEMAQAGQFTEEVERNFAEGIKYLEMKGVSAITGDCGFMMAFQVLARKIAAKPVFMSSMVQCPVIAAAFDPKDLIMILTANGHSLKPQKDVLLNSCGFDVNEDRFIIVGCQDVPGFDAVAKGQAVPLDIVQPGIVKMVTDILKQRPRISAILLECTELPPYADALRAATSLPVWDAITGADFYVSAFRDNPRFGVDDWQQEWDDEQEEYQFGMNLIEKDREALVNKRSEKPKKKPPADAIKKATKTLRKRQAPILGVIRLDYSYPPAKGDIDCPGSYDYDVLFRMVPGLTFEMAQQGKMTFEVEKEFKLAVKWLEAKGVCGITGDCGFMMAFQPIARDIANVPVFMSAMCQCPMISVAFDKYDKILILTANSATLKPQKQTLLSQCGFDVDDNRFVIYGCQDVPGFDAVAKGEKVDVQRVTPGIVKMTLEILRKIPTIRAICLECTELPPYADALRSETKLPVFDAITVCDFFVSAGRDNPRFGLNNWQTDWDKTVDEYKLGDNLTKEQRNAALFV